MPVILGMYTVQAATADGGLASMLPTVGDVQGYCDVLIALSGGPLTSQFHLQVVQPMGGSQPGKPRGDARYIKDDGQQRTRDRETVER